MKIDLRELSETSGTVTGTDRAEFLDAAGEETVLECDVEVRYSHVGGAYYLHVLASGRMQTACHRCLDPVTVPLEAEFDVVVRRGLDRAGEHGDPETEDHYITVGANEHEVDIHPQVRENLVVSVPMLILCSQECRGLCPSCGINRNRGTCGCEPAPDPRWEALRRLGGE